MNDTTSRGHDNTMNGERTVPEASLPTWEQMSDLDKGAALLHMWKRDYEGDEYAIENYPCVYIESPALLALSADDACEHAETVTGGYEEIVDQLGDEEWDRLYDLALIEGERVLRSRKLWAVRYEHGSVYEVDSQQYVQSIAYGLESRSRVVELLRRVEPGGAWTVVADLRGLEQFARLSGVRPGDQVLRGDDWIEVAETGDYERTGGWSGGAPIKWVQLADGTRVDLPYYDPKDDPDRYKARIRRGPSPV